jgi:ferredoxin
MVLHFSYFNEQTLPEYYLKEPGIVLGNVQKIVSKNELAQSTIINFQKKTNGRLRMSIYNRRSFLQQSASLVLTESINSHSSFASVPAGSRKEISQENQDAENLFNIGNSSSVQRESDAAPKNIKEQNIPQKGNGDYKTSKIFYFSGTGNSLRVAQLLTNELGNSMAIPIPSTKNGIDLNDVDVVGIIFPIYAWTMPRMVRDFLKKLTAIKKQNCYYFAVCTMKSQSGIAIEQIQTMFNDAGLKLSASYEVAMPGNAILAYDIEDIEPLKNIISNADHQIVQIADDIKYLRVNAHPKTPILRYAFVNIMGSIGLSMTPDKKYRTNGNCNGCGICKSLCPSCNIEIENKKPLWLKKNCEYCMACIHWCPHQAIQCGNITVNRKRYHHPSVTVKEMVLN